MLRLYLWSTRGCFATSSSYAKIWIFDRPPLAGCCRQAGKERGGLAVGDMQADNEGAFEQSRYRGVWMGLGFRSIRFIRSAHQELLGLTYPVALAVKWGNSALHCFDRL